MYEKDVKTTFPQSNRFILGLISVLALFSAGIAAASSTPQVSVTVSPTIVDREVLQTAQFTISLSAPASRDIGVVLFMWGTARFGFDYVLNGNFNHAGEIVIPAGQTSTTVTLQPRTLDARFARESAVMNLVHDVRSVHTYSLGSPTRANVTIAIQ